MEIYNYSEIKEDVLSIIREMIEDDTSIDKGLSRALVEYWLDPAGIEKPKPTPYSLKLLAAIAIGSIRKENHLQVSEILKSISWLTDNISPKSISIDPSSIEKLLIDIDELYTNELSTTIKKLLIV